MSPFLIRLYKDSDYAAARKLFSGGTNEHIDEAFKRAMRQPPLCLALSALIILPLLDIVSFMTSLVAAAMVVFCVRMLVWHFFEDYIKSSLLDDMLDIQRYYMKQDDRCFWVAEAEGQTVGIVAAAPSPYPGGENHMELKRLSVSKSHRGRGIAKALCKAAVDFARQSGREAVILTTNIVQADARKMYEKMGFRLSHTFYLPHRFIKTFDLKTLFYRYDLQKPHQ